MSYELTVTFYTRDPVASLAEIEAEHDVVASTFEEVEYETADLED